MEQRRGRVGVVVVVVVVGGGWALLEGGPDGAALERLRGPVVVHHAALSLTFGREEETTESGHLRKHEMEMKLDVDADFMHSQKW
uniref:Uncharacterized protein n=1 Tax=Knipowitschia caucasica TaxID=637954 RepID=A0AAV2L861_KNICA